MQLAAAFLPGVTAGAGAAAAVGTGAGLSALSAGATVLSAIAAFASGAAEANRLREDAAMAEFDADSEANKGRENNAQLLAELKDTMANQAIAFAAGGATLSSPSLESARDQVARDAEVEFANNANNTVRKRQRLARRADQLRKSASMAMLNGVVGGIGALANGFG
jgi:hypothetical protein